MSTTPPPARALLDFWFAGCLADATLVPARLKAWFRSTRVFDRDIEQRFGELMHDAAAGALRDWETDPRGRLALVIAQDQFTRNIHRGTAAAFAGDAEALRLARQGVARGHDTAMHPLERAFLYLPLEHAEDPQMQALSVERCRLNLAGAPPEHREPLRQFMEAALEHADIVRRFGRFPHRNRPLGRDSTTEEIAYLDAGARRFGQ